MPGICFNCHELGADALPDQVTKMAKKEFPGQISLFDFSEPDVGQWIKSHGAVICGIMRPAYVGKKICWDQSTQSMTLYKIGILEKLIPDCYYHNGIRKDCDRAVIYTGKKQRSSVLLMPGREIYEPLPWDHYPERMAAIGNHKK